MNYECGWIIILLMNIIIIKPEEISDDIAVLSGGRFQHIKNVLKCSQGSVLKAGILGGMTGSATVEKIDGSSVTLSLCCRKMPPADPRITVILALPRPKVFRRIFFGMVCAGVKNIHVINSWRVDKSYWDSPYLSKLDEYAFDGLQQSRDTILPTVSFHRYFMNFIEETLPALPAENRFLAHPYNTGNTVPNKPAVIAVGCEGGFIEREADTFIERGFKPFSLGERILTTEYAVPYILGMLNK